MLHMHVYHIREHTCLVLKTLQNKQVKNIIVLIIIQEQKKCTHMQHSLIINILPKKIYLLLFIGVIVGTSLKKFKIPNSKKSPQFFPLLKCITTKMHSHTFQKLPFLTLSISACDVSSINLHATNFIITYLNISSLPCTCQLQHNIIKN